MSMPSLTHAALAASDLQLGLVLVTYDRARVTGLQMRADGSVDLYLDADARPVNLAGDTPVLVEILESAPTRRARAGMAVLEAEVNALAVTEGSLLAIDPGAEPTVAVLEPEVVDAELMDDTDPSLPVLQYACTKHGNVAHIVNAEANDSTAVCGWTVPYAVDPDSLPICRRCERMLGES